MFQPRDLYLQSTTVAYCDYIANIISSNLHRVDDMSLIDTVSSPKLDLDANGSYQSTKKVIQLSDLNGRLYKITVEEA
jgi:hypothetical protein